MPLYISSQSTLKALGHIDTEAGLCIMARAALEKRVEGLGTGWGGVGWGDCKDEGGCVCVCVDLCCVCACFGRRGRGTGRCVCVLMLWSCCWKICWLCQAACRLLDLWILLIPPIVRIALNLFVMMDSSRLQVFVTVGPPTNQGPQEKLA